MEKLITLNGDKKKLELTATPALNMFQLISTHNEKGYFTHLSSLHLNRLVTDLPNTFYYNIERSKKNKRNNLTQESIDKAFAKPARLSNNLFKTDSFELYILNSQYTNRLGVKKHQDGFYYTDIERTLIDSSIRPQYCGGLNNVIKSFTAAKGKIDLNKLRFYLDSLDYSYPYEQVIGFYLDKADYDISDQNIFYTLNRYNLRFYLIHGSTNNVYNAKWNLYVPGDI